MSALKNGPSSSRLDFSRRIDEEGVSVRQLIVILALSVLVLFDGMNNQMPALIARDLTRDLGLPLSGFGLVFSSGVIGSILGALLMGPVADLWLGRKRVLLMAMGLAGVCTVLAAHAGMLSEFVLLRFLTGIGLGAAMPNIVALGAEFSPPRVSRQHVSLLLVFMPLGSLLGGVLARSIVPQFDWRMLLQVAGIATLALTAVAGVIVPESVQFLIHRKGDYKRAMAAARRLSPSADRTAVKLQHGDAGAKHDRGAAEGVFGSGLWKLTLTLWLILILGQAILFFILGWMPALLVKSGMSSSVGMDAAMSLGIGGAIGTAAEGWLTARFGIYRVMFPQIAVYIVAMLTLPLALGHALILHAILLVVAVTFYAYLTGVVLLVVESYPEEVGSTALGWSLAVGRIGGSGAPVLVGFLLGIGWSPTLLFIGAGVLGAVTGVALIGARKLAVERARG
ncbi:MAG TPA: MFS transporter, partial [Steroidobacteraceae bacterium]|nr:MFS transporter [Steroidobacteraceae bacterium]